MAIYVRALVTRLPAKQKKIGYELTYFWTEGYNFSLEVSRTTCVYVYTQLRSIDIYAHMIDGAIAALHD